MKDIDGRCDVRLNSNRTQAAVTIYPPHGDGKEISASEIKSRLQQMRIGPNIREQALFEGVLQARASAAPVEVIAAQGVFPVDGQDAKIRCRLPESVLRRHPPKHAELLGAVNWFALNPLQLVKKGQEIASIAPVKAGIMGKTCTLPQEDVPYMPGKPVEGAIGENVEADAYALRAFAMEEGYLYLNGERLTVIPLSVRYHEEREGERFFSRGALLYEGAASVQIVAQEFLAIRKTTKNCVLRADGDVLLQSAENCVIIASGSVFVEDCLINCDVRTPNKVVCSAKSRLMGGAIRAYKGITAGVVGAEDHPETLLEAGNDYYSPIRKAEVERELVERQYNLRRIQATLKPFEDSPVHKTLKNYRDMVEKCQALRSAELDRIRSLKREQKRLDSTEREFVSATIEARRVYPGTLIRNGRLQKAISAEMQDVQFSEAFRRTEIQATPLAKAG